MALAGDAAGGSVPVERAQTSRANRCISDTPNKAARVGFHVQVPPAVAGGSNSKTVPSASPWWGRGPLVDSVKANEPTL